MTGELLRFPLTRVVKFRYFRGSHTGSDDAPELGRLHEAQRSVEAAIGALQRQRLSLHLRVLHLKGFKPLFSDTRRQWDARRKQALYDFTTRMMRRFRGVDDEHLLRWIDRLKSSEPPTAASEPIELHHVSEPVRSIVARCEAGLPPDGGGTAA